MRAGVGYSDNPDTAVAGRHAAERAIATSGRSDPCDLVLLFGTIRHNQRILREAVAAVAGASVPVYGGGAAGIITNDDYGYAGDQVGVACLWLDGVACDIFTDGGLLEDGERMSGLRLGRRLARAGVTPDSPIMLFYESVGINDASGIRMLMATWILEGLEEALGFRPNITGAGLMGDQVGSRTSQYVGTEIADHYAMALTFDEDIRIDSVIMHGCRPASAYYTVTKADGPVILEIDRRPALTFMDELLGHAIKPEQYPFFLLFGINSGERWGEYDEDKYASRMCLGIDRERGGIVMFEPDMVAGTEFQLMSRSSDLAYMRPKFESVFKNLNGREPVFAVYFDCVGRCAGYGGTDVEDALALQQSVAGRVPVLGIYTGVEIGAVAGRPRGLDLTGVFCLFSQSAGNNPASYTDDPARKGAHMRPPLPLVRRGPPPVTPAEFLNRLCEKNAAGVLALDIQATTLRYELELKRRGFRLLSELAVYLRRTDGFMDMFVLVARRMNAALNMQKTVVLLADGDGAFAPAVLQGFAPEEQDRLMERHISLPDGLLGLCPTVVAADSAPECFRSLCEDYNLPFLIASPIYLQGEVSALLFTGRMVVQEPFFTRLGNGDLETVHAITELLGSVLVRQHLKDITVQAETDGLTGLCNRNAFRRVVETYLSGGNCPAGAFMMIDVDYFKSVNDTYGHISGDRLLKGCAAAMRGVLRDSDVIGRQGGDEFVVFCRGIRDGATAEKKAAQIAKAWESVIPGEEAILTRDNADINSAGIDGTSANADAREHKHITASIGISLCPDHGATFHELYNKADSALYMAKERGRNRYVLYDAAAGAGI